MARVPHISELSLDVMFPDKFLKAAHLQGHTPIVTIENIKVDIVPMSGGKKSAATIITFKNKQKEFICNKTNGFAIGVLLGSQRPIDWIGKRIQLTADIEDDRKTRQEVPCIRVLGSPDASPEQAAEYRQCWRGQRKGGALCARLKMAVQRMLTAGRIAPVEPAPDVVVDDDDGPEIEPIPEDDWSDDDIPTDAQTEPKTSAPAQASEQIDETHLSPSGK